jgi:hypothetical protein
MSRLFLSVLLLGACKEEGGGSLSGEIALDELDYSARVDAAAAFAWHVDDQLLVYISSDPGASCAGVVTYLSGGGDLEPLFEGGLCNVYIKLDQGYADGFTAQDDPLYAAGTALGCPMGEGTFGGEAENYRWSGIWWQGYPTTYSYAFSEDADGNYLVELDMSAYNGSLPYEGQAVNVTAAGSVSGSLTATACPGLEDTALFY